MIETYGYGDISLFEIRISIEWIELIVPASINKLTKELLYFFMNLLWNAIISEEIDEVIVFAENPMKFEGKDSAEGLLLL